MKKARKILSIIFPSIVLAFLAISFLVNLPLAKQPFEDLKAGNTDFSGFIDQIEEVYKAEVENKNDYININGLYARAIGRNEYNEVTRLKNGMLTYLSIPERDMDAFANGIIEFEQFLEKSDIEYTFVQCPNKSDLNDTLLPTGTNNFGNKNANRLMENLNKADVDVIDLRAPIAGSVELVEKYFYVTDHHWNTDASFYAYQQIVEMLKEKFPDAEFDENALLESSWNREIYEDWFLGSHGKRVGKYYAGIDDYILYTPKFETDMSFYIPKHKQFFSGDFEKVVVRDYYLDEPNYFGETPYCTYLGGDYPIVHHVNMKAKNDLKVLILKDSFTLAAQSFLATQVKEIDVIDPRYYTDTTIAEYVATSMPDIVITMINPSSFASKTYCNTGVARGQVHAEEVNEKVLGSVNSLKVVADSDKPYKNVILTDYITDDDNKYVLKNNSKYTLRISDVEILKGKSDGFTVALFDQNSQKVLTLYSFDLDAKNSEGYYEWSFLTPESGDTRLKVLLYAGLHGKTGGNTFEFKNVYLSRWTSNSEKVLNTVKTFEVTAPKDNRYKNVVVTDYITDDDNRYLLKNNSEYTIKISDARVIAGAADGFSVALYDNKSQKVLNMYSFDFSEKDLKGHYEWSFTTPQTGDTRLKVLLYAGMHGKTAGNTLEFTDVSLSRWEK